MGRRPMTRRDLLRALGTATFGAFPATVLAGRYGQPEKRAAAAPTLRVALIRCPDYEPRNLLAAIQAGWRSTRPPDVKGKRIVIKPNIADFSENRPIHAHAHLVGALIIHLKERGAREIILAEGTPQNRDSEWIFRKAGFEALARDLAVPLIDLNYDNVRSVRNANPRATLLRDLYLPETILSAEVLISVAKMKTHKLAGITLSLKNMFGIVPGIKYGWPKNILHWNGIPLSICEINGTVKTHYAVVDGVVGMEGHGPIMGTAKQAGVLVMGDNSLAVDATAARVMGVDPARVDYLALAQQIKLGSLLRESIDVAGEDIDKARTDFALDPDFSRLRAPAG